MNDDDSVDEVYHTSMPRVAPVVPAETDILCEKCGYTLNGLPESGNCPECGQPIAASTNESLREPATWEVNHTWQSFIATTISVLFRPTQFFRTVTTRTDIPPAKQFAEWHWVLASLLFASTAYFHADWYIVFSGWVRITPITRFMMWFSLFVGTFLTFVFITKLAARLTNWEATYRGLRMPLVPVLRGMYYHSAHYLPVAFIALVTVVGFTKLYNAGFLPATSATTYLYVLCIEVVLGAVYLFHTYWIAMRNMMYANR